MQGRSRLVGLLLSLLLLVALGTSDVEGFCYRKNPPKSQDGAVEQINQQGNYSIYVCVKSIDLATDLEKAPKVNTSQILFSMSVVEKIKNEAFLKFASSLVKIEIWSSKLVEIEGGAFNGLRELKGLALPRNELTVLKAAWFKDTQKLIELNLADNRIASIEMDFTKSLPALQTLDLRGNELAALPNDFVKQLPSSLIHLNLYNNPMNYKQTQEVTEWGKVKEDKANELKCKELKHLLELTKNCLEDKSVTDKTNDSIDKCVEDKLNAEFAAAIAKS